MNGNETAMNSSSANRVVEKNGFSHKEYFCLIEYSKKRFHGKSLQNQV